MKKWHWIALIAVIVLSLLAQFFGDIAEEESWYNKLPAFWAVYGFTGCFLIIVVSKAIGKYFLQKKEDYYDEP